jgi:DHA1 family bicyclomycin/chloramphenicol resistance-like MFS transporter
MTQAVEQTPGHARRIAVLVAFMTMLAPFSIDTYLPSFPDIAREFGATQVQMQQTLSLYLLAFALTTLVYGPLADAFGRRIVVLWAIALYAIASLGCAFSNSIGELLLFRIAQGLTASAGFVVGRAMVRDVFAGARAQKVMSNIMLLFAIAPAIAPVIGGYLHDAFGWRTVFWFLATIGAALWLLVYLKLPETLAPSERHSIHPVAVGRVYGRALTTSGFMLLVAMIALNFGGMFLYVAGAPVLVYEHLGLSADDFSVLFVPLVSGIMLGSFTSARLAGRVDMVRFASFGYLCMAAAVLFNLGQSYWLPGHAALVVAPVAIYAFGNALTVPTLSILALDYFPQNRGMASSAQGFLHTGGNALVAGALVPLVAHTLAGMAIGMTVLYVTSLALWLGWLRARTRDLDPQAEGRGQSRLP